MHNQTRQVLPKQCLTRASCIRVQSCTRAGLGVSTLCTPIPHKHAQNGRTSSRRRSGCARSCRSRTRCSKSRHSARTRLSSHRCSGRRRTSRGTRRAPSRERSLVPCRSVSRLVPPAASIRLFRIFLILMDNFLICSYRGRARSRCRWLRGRCLDRVPPRFSM
jgi:hypothetical protein